MLHSFFLWYIRLSHSSDRNLQVGKGGLPPLKICIPSTLKLITSRMNGHES